LRRLLLALTAILPGLAPAFGQEQGQAQGQAQPSQWYQVPTDASFITGDSWTSQGTTYRLYGVQACLRGTYFTNASGIKRDCGEVGLTMLVALIRDLRPWCYTAAQNQQARINYVICVATLVAGDAKGSRLDLATSLISTGYAFAAVQPTGEPVSTDYMVAQAVAQKTKAGLWAFADVPDPNVAILKAIREQQAATPQAPQ